MTENFFEKIKKRKKFLFLSVALLVVLFLVLSISSVFLKKPLPSTPSDEISNSIGKEYNYIPLQKEDCDKFDGKKREVCYNEIALRDAVYSKNIKECLNIKDLNKRNDCLLYLIESILKNDDLCYKILDHSKKMKCIDKVTRDKKDEKLCEKNFKGEPFEIQECKDRVMAFKIAESGEKDDILKCGDIKSLEYPNLCYMYSFKNKFNNNCEEVPLELRDLCDSFLIANYGATVEMCDHIKIQEYKDYCQVRFKVGGGDIRAATWFDTDGDGLGDGDELFFRTDIHNPDTDGDGLNDKEEFVYGTNPMDPNTDDDGLNDFDEVKIYETNPNKPDTDGDGIWDGEEVKNGTNPISGDTDKDELLDVDEIKFGTNINNPDTNEDGISDKEEFYKGINPNGGGFADSDKDGLLDIDEIFYGTDRFNPDTDGDGIGDKEEVDNLTNPLGPGDMDFDGDGLSDKDEEKYGTNPTTDDIDRDELTDAEELFIYKTDPNKRDTDNDGYSDGEEVKKGYNPLYYDN